MKTLIAKVTFTIIVMVFVSSCASDGSNADVTATTTTIEPIQLTASDSSKIEAEFVSKKLYHDPSYYSLELISFSEPNLFTRAQKKFGDGNQYTLYVVDNALTPNQYYIEGPEMVKARLEPGYMLFERVPNYMAIQSAFLSGDAEVSAIPALISEEGITEPVATTEVTNTPISNENLPENSALLTVLTSATAPWFLVPLGILLLGTLIFLLIRTLNRKRNERREADEAKNQQLASLDLEVSGLKNAANLNLHPVTSGEPKVVGGLPTIASAQEHVRAELTRRGEVDFIIISTETGYLNGNGEVGYKGDVYAPRNLRNEPGYESLVQLKNKTRIMVHHLQGCGNDIRSGVKYKNFTFTKQPLTGNQEMDKTVIQNQYLHADESGEILNRAAQGADLITIEEAFKAQRNNYAATKVTVRFENGNVSFVESETKEPVNEHSH